MPSAGWERQLAVLAYLAAPPPDTEELKMRKWVLSQLTDAGLEMDQAVTVYAMHGDWRRAVRLLGQGCAPELALEIVL